MRTIPALLVTVGLVASLTACAASGTPRASSCSAPASGSASESVSATGTFGSKPKVSVPGDLKTKKTETSVIHSGDGQLVGKGTPVQIGFTVVDGRTGKTAQTSGYSKKKTSPATLGAKSLGELGKALECSHVGDRVAVVMTIRALNGGSATSKTAQSAVVVVADIKRAYPSRATGRPQIAKDGMPAVVLAPNGAPGITVPSTDAPKHDEVSLLRKGSGAALTRRDTALLNYTAVSWGSDSSVVGSSWTDGNGAVTQALQQKSDLTNALVGKHVGDQVLAILPSNGSMVVYVLDVLGTV